MHTSPDMVVMGDINLDWVVSRSLALPFADLKENGIIVWEPIQELPGGSGLNFARFAHEVGFHPLLIGKVGDDLAGKFVIEWLKKIGIAVGVSMDTSLSTGRAFIVRDKNDIRFLVNNDVNANRALSVSDLESHRSTIASCRVLYVSGYCLMDSKASRYEATLHAMEVARTTDCPQKPLVIFDVVPHRIYEKYSFEKFKTLTVRVDIMISEVATMRRFLGLGSRAEKVDHKIAEETVEHLQPHYHRFILRYGDSGCDKQILWDAERDSLQWNDDTGHQHASDKRGFGDQLALRDLRCFFGVHPTEGLALPAL